MIAPTGFDEVQSFVTNATRNAVRFGHMLVTGTGFRLLLSLLIIIVIIVLLLSQEDLGVGMAL